MPDPEGIYHWRRIDRRITTSGQPTEAELTAIAALGVQCVVNLGLHDHPKALADEAGSVTRLGMRYIHIPVDFNNPTDADFAAFCTAMAANAGVAVHVHCIANYRVSAFLYRYRRTVCGVDAARAGADLDQVWQPDGVWAAFVARV